MKTTIFRGHDLAAEVNARTGALIAQLGRPPRCVVLLDPGNPAMAAYARRQREAASALGIALKVMEYAARPQAVLDQLAGLRRDSAVDAAVALHPLPEGVDASAAAEAIGSDKDVDGQNPLNAGRLALGEQAAAPATARACALVLSRLLPRTEGAEVVIVGASRVVGRPLAALLLDAGATVTICHVATRELAEHTRRADVVVTAAGVPGLIGADAIRPGAIVLDVAIVRQGGRLLGDVDLASVMGQAALVTHVPDGIGPVTTACLFENVARAALARG